MRGSLDASHFYTSQHPLCVNGLIRFGKTVRCEMGKIKCVNMLAAAVNLFCLEMIPSHWKLVPVLTACWSSMTFLLASLGFHQNNLGSSHRHSDYSLRFWNWFHLLKCRIVKKWRLGLNCLQPLLFLSIYKTNRTSRRPSKTTAPRKALHIDCYISSLQDLYLYPFWVSQDVVSMADSSS